MNYTIRKNYQQHRRETVKFFLRKICPTWHPDWGNPRPVSANVGGFSFEEKIQPMAQTDRGMPPPGWSVGHFA